MVATKLSSNDIQNALSNVGAIAKNDQDVLSKCIGLASLLDITADQLADSWTVHSLNRKVHSLDVHAFDAFRMDVIREYRDKIDETNVSAVVTRLAGSDGGSGVKRPQPSIPNVTPPAKKINNFNSKGNEQKVALPIPDNNRSRMSMIPSLPQPKRIGTETLPNNYSTRADPGKSTISFNPSNLSKQSGQIEQNGPKCDISTMEFSTNVDKSYRHMFTTIDERSNALDKQLRFVGDCMIDRYNLGALDETSENETSDGVAGIEEVGIPRQEKVCCIGRVCNSAHEGRINSTSVLLEGSRNGSGGARVDVDLSKLVASKTSFSLFPGQIVAIEGFNTSGRTLVADRICEGAAYQQNTSTAQELLKYHHDERYQSGQPLKIISAAGPFTTSDNLDYQPFFDLIKVVRRTVPDVVILIGPFVDSRHPSLESGQAAMTDEEGTDIVMPYEALFANKICGLIEEFYRSNQGTSTQFVIVPSLDDTVAEWVFPQPPFNTEKKGQLVDISGGEGLEIGTLGLHSLRNAARKDGSKYPRIHCVSNPCTLRINEIVIGITSADVLFDVNSDSTSANIETNRLARTAQHLLQQRSYYPLFPGALGCNLNLSRIDQWKIPCSLDLLLIPSKLNSCVHRLLDSTIFVNHGHLCKGTTCGSFAEIDIHPINRETIESAGGEDVELAHNIQDRVQIEIKRI